MPLLLYVVFFNVNEVLKFLSATTANGNERHGVKVNFFLFPHDPRESFFLWRKERKLQLNFLWLVPPWDGKLNIHCLICTTASAGISSSMIFGFDTFYIATFQTFSKDNDNILHFLALRKKSSFKCNLLTRRKFTKNCSYCFNAGYRKVVPWYEKPNTPKEKCVLLLILNLSP